MMVVVFLSVLTSPIGLVAQEINSNYFNTANLSDGIIHINYSLNNNKKIKLIIEKGNQKYTYNLKKDGNIETFPLQMGSGQYKISILENKESNKYTYVEAITIDVKIKDDQSLYLSSIQNINWDESMAPIKKAQELMTGKQNDKEKIKSIYDYIVRNYKYDYAKVDKLEYDYLPDIQRTFLNDNGICYDFASLYAAMLRSQGIPAKLVTGYTDNVNGYHAWNEVYIQSENRWIIVDPTFDLQMIAAKKNVALEKNKNNYTKVYEY